MAFDRQSAEGQANAARVAMPSTFIDLTELLEDVFALIGWNATGREFVYASEKSFRAAVFASQGSYRALSSRLLASRQNQ
jgi:hypothetical protein